MEKYSGLKTIGDGTYGSVVKAMNMKTGKKTWSYMYRGNCGYQKNEKEVLQVGLLYQPERNTFFDEASSSQYSSTLRSYIGEECAALCFWIPRPECLSVNER